MAATAPASRSGLAGGAGGPWLRRFWRGHDVPLVYAGVVAVVSVLSVLRPFDLLADAVEQSSTNLVNMASKPLAVLVLSAFVVTPLWQLVLLVPVVAVYGAVQRWLGRVGAFVVAALGHVGATLFVMAMEITALHRHIVGFDVVVKPDVGVSYGLAAALGVLLAAVRPRWRTGYGLVSLAVVAAQLVGARDFTSLGHAVAWTIGLCLALVASRADRQGTTG